jgi:MoaA/NifB/PqqE/SkfB family radical SAM enzyme
MTKNNFPINPAKHELDSPERLLLYDKYRGEGWEKEYKKYRYKWNEDPKKFIVNDYPLNVDLELSSICNLTCPMCYLQSQKYKNNNVTPFMSKELFKKLVNEISINNIPALKLNFRGEPTLHPNFIELVKYAKHEKKIKEISMTTNISKLTKDFFAEIIDCLDWINISIDGLNETYEKIRKPLKFVDTLQKIKDIRNIKEKYNTHKPVIRIQTVWSAIENNYEEYYNTFAPYVEQIGYNPVFDFNKSMHNYIFIPNFSCSQIYQRLQILSDGRAVLCCFDTNANFILGDAKKQSIHKIWHGKQINSIRAAHEITNGFKKIPICRENCYFNRKVINPKTIKIDTRKINVNTKYAEK